MGIGAQTLGWLVVLAITASVMALFPLGFINFEFQPYIDRGGVYHTARNAQDISMEESNALVQRAKGAVQPPRGG
jgi:HAE1 family hydrophobic/amphiphilic exporter-1